MDIRPIKTESDYEKALARIAELMGAKLNSPEGDELEVRSTLVDAYESQNLIQGVGSLELCVMVFQRI